jgi:hypothetical protein
MQITPQATATFPLGAKTDEARNAWLASWPDAVAFVGGLAVARWAGWNTGDLIWSLWLSSFVVGYATIVWIIGRPAVGLVMTVWKARDDPSWTPRGMAIVFGIVVFVAGFMLTFFTIHFGGFHYVHSDILLYFFPISTPGIAHPSWASREVYLEILRRYWIFLPSAFLSHRAAFMKPPIVFEKDRWKESFTGPNARNKDLFFEPYRNVLRMHGLIFFFFFAHFLGLENFLVYAVVYAVYFFPWQLVRRESDAT